MMMARAPVARSRLDTRCKERCKMKITIEVDPDVYQKLQDAQNALNKRNLTQGEPISLAQVIRRAVQLGCAQLVDGVK